MNVARHLIAWTLASASALSAAGQTESKSAVDPASWVPSDALAYVGVSDIEEFSDQFRQTAFYKMMQDPNAKGLGGQASSLVLKFYEQFKTRLARSLDIEPDELKSPLAGPLAVYVAAPRGDLSGSLKAVFVAGIGDANLMKDYYDRARRKFAEIADKHEQIPFGSRTLDRFTTETREEQDKHKGEEFDEVGFDVLSTDEQSLAAALDEVFGQLFAADAMPQELVLCLTEDRLIVAPTVAHAQAVLQRAQAGGSLVETEVYQTLLREFQPLGSVRLLLNLQGLFEIMEAAAGADAREALALLGLKSMQSVIGHVLYDGKQFASKFEALLLLSGERAGLAKILTMKNRALTPPASVSADSLMYASLNVNVTAVLDEVEQMIRRDDPEAADELRASMESIELPDGQILNLRQELLEKLHEPLTFTLGFRRPDGPQSAGILLTLGHRDKEAMVRFLEKLSTMLPGAVLARELGGTLAYDIPFLGFSLAPTDDAILVGTTNAVDAALRAPVAEQSLAADARFKRAAALAPRAAWGVVYVDSRRMLEAALELAEKRDALSTTHFANPANLLVLRIAETIATGGQQQRIDAVRQLSRHLGPRMITLTTTPCGIRLTQIDLLPEDE